MATASNGQGSSGPPGDRNPLLDLQRRQARYVAEAGQIVLDAMSVLAKHQADALHQLLQDMERQGENATETSPGALLEEVRERCLHLALHTFATQVKLGLESAMTINGTALEILQRGLTPDRRPARETAVA